MKELNISDEMFARFLEGKTDAEENARLLQAMEAEGVTAEDLVAIGEAAKRADRQSLVSPDLAKAEEQIRTVLSNSGQNKATVFMDRRKSRIVWIIAASAVLVLAVALFVLFRPERSDQNFAQQEENRVEELSKKKGVKSQTIAETATDETENVRQGEITPKKDNEGAHSEQNDAPPALINPQKLEKNYTETKTANSLTVTKPNKNDYRVLCKNLEKSLQFEWAATDVKTLHFAVTNSKGKTIAETKDITANQLSLEYGDVYPEQKLTWRLIVVFKDDTQDMRGGQIRIDYQIN